MLPGFGGDPGQALGNVANRLYMRNYQQQRLALQAEAKRQQSGQFLERFLDPKQYLSGTAYDPMIVSSINEALQKGAEMAEQGADIPTMIMGLGSYTNRINDYSNKAKLISKQVDDTIAKLKETGAKGYDYAAMKDQALRQAFHKFDASTGEDQGLQDIGNVDPSRNYVMETLQQRPDMVTNAADIDEFAKNTEKTERTIDNTTIGANMRPYKHKVSFVGQNYLVPEYDKQGRYQEAVPKYETATDGENAITHTFVDANGNETKAPVRLLANDIFDDLTQRKGVGDYIRGQVMKHIREYNQANGSNIDLDSPQAHLVARAIAYDALKNRRNGALKQTDQEGRPSSAEVNLHFLGGKYQQAYDTRMGRGDAEYELGVEGKLPKKGKDPKISTIDALHEIGNNNPDYLDEDPEEHNGKAVIDVLSQLPKGQLKYGPAKFQSYKHVYYDPQDHSFTLLKNDKTSPEQTIQEKDFPKFVHSVAALNGGATADVPKSLNKYGYANGKFAKAGDAPDLAPALQERRQTLVNNALGAETEEQRSRSLKDSKIRIPEGIVTGYKERTGIYSLWNSNYQLQYKKPNGETDVKGFKSMEAMEHYLKNASTLKSSKPAEATQPAAAAPGAELTDKEKAALKKYNQQ